ncbi:MAG: DUF4082 domain-containing protein [Saprospiraceae bacterium]|nr:DUF4082 domain-containing protein [Saprospiraceae bacterium]
MKKIYLVFIFLYLTLSSSEAQVPGLDVTPDIEFSNGNWSLGWRFQVNTTSVITSLGVFDDNGGNGLNAAMPVGLYTDAGVLLASATVPAGTGATLINNFRYVSIAPVAVTAGSIYRIAALHINATGDLYGYCGGACPTTTAPQVTYLDDRFTSSSTLVFPTNNSGRIGYFGGNFLIGQTVVPTLGQWGLIILGLLIISISSIIIVQRRNALAMNNTSKN